MVSLLAISGPPVHADLCIYTKLMAALSQFACLIAVITILRPQNLLCSMLSTVYASTQDFMYSPMRTIMPSRSFEGSRRALPADDTGIAIGPQLAMSREQVDSVAGPLQHSCTPSAPYPREAKALTATRQGSDSSTKFAPVVRQLSFERKCSGEWPNSPYSTDTALLGMSPFRSDPPTSFDRKPRKPASAIVYSSQRPSSTWHQVPTSAAVTPNPPLPAQTPHSFSMPMHRHHSLRSSVSSLPDIDELDIADFSTGTENHAAAPATLSNQCQPAPAAKQAQDASFSGFPQPASCARQARPLQGALFRRPSLPDAEQLPSADRSTLPGTSNDGMQAITQAGPQPIQTAATWAVQTEEVPQLAKAQSNQTLQQAVSQEVDKLEANCNSTLGNGKLARADSRSGSVLSCGEGVRNGDSPLQIPMQEVAVDRSQSGIHVVMLHSMPTCI